MLNNCLNINLLVTFNANKLTKIVIKTQKNKFILGSLFRRIFYAFASELSTKDKDSQLSLHKAQIYHNEDNNIIFEFPLWSSRKWIYKSNSKNYYKKNCISNFKHHYGSLHCPMLRPRPPSSCVILK
jgi:hypothetical protein